MEADDFDDMLFGLDASQDDSRDALSDNSDDDVLEVLDGDENILWDQKAESLLMPATTDCQYGEQIDTQDNELRQMRKQLPTTCAVRPIRDRDWIIARIEAMLERIVDGLLEESDALTITLNSRAGFSRRQARVVNADGKFPEPKRRDINFPGANAQEAWNFTVLLRILELVHGGLVDNIIMTKRDIFYRHPDLFIKQAVVDRYVDDLACTFGITRSQLNVTAAAKGLVAGGFSITRRDGYLIDGMKDKEGLLVPKIDEDDTLDLASIHWVLVIEKEATFRALLSSPQWRKLGLHGLVLTAKGYPDVASRKFLRYVADQAPHVPMHALGDLDPDGIAILSTYTYGSYRLAHEDITPSNTLGLSLPNMRWLGVKRHHISRTPAGESDTDTRVMPEFQGLMRLTERDRTKAVRMLEWDLCAEDGPERCWRQELQAMLMSNIKAEIQILDELPGGLVSWLGGKLREDCGQSLEQSSDSLCSGDGMLF